jgi:hypothetical protein
VAFENLLSVLKVGFTWAIITALSSEKNGDRRQSQAYLGSLDSATSRKTYIECRSVNIAQDQTIKSCVTQVKYSFVYLHWHFDENNALYSANVKKPYAKEATEVCLHLRFQSSFLQSFNALHLQQN